MLVAWLPLWYSASSILAGVHLPTPTEKICKVSQSYCCYKKDLAQTKPVSWQVVTRALTLGFHAFLKDVSIVMVLTRLSSGNAIGACLQHQ